MITRSEVGVQKEIYTYKEEKRGNERGGSAKGKHNAKKKREVEVKWEGTRTEKREGMKRVARKSDKK